MKPNYSLYPEVDIFEYPVTRKVSKSTFPVFGLPNTLTVNELLYTNIQISSTLRKKHRGKWYLIDFYQSRKVHSSENLEDVKKNYLERLRKDVYCAILFRVVNTKMVDKDGYPIFLLDSDQRDEKERLFNLKK